MNYLYSLFPTPPPPPPPPDAYNALLNGASASFNASDSWFFTVYPNMAVNSLRSAFGAFAPRFWFDMLLGLIFAVCFLRLLWRTLRISWRVAYQLWSLTADAPQSVFTFLLTVLTGVLTIYILLQSRAQFPDRHDTIVQTVTIVFAVLGEYLARFGASLMRLFVPA
jgi:hypothetical protein